MTRKIIHCNNKEVTISGDGIQYTYRFTGFEIKIIDGEIKDKIYRNLDIFIENDPRSKNLGRKFAKNLDNGLISWEWYKWLNSHCYTNKTKTWLTNGRFMCEIEVVLFGFKLRKKLQGQCNYEPVVFNNQEVFDMVFKETHEKFSPCPVCIKSKEPETSSNQNDCDRLVEIFWK